VQFIFYYSYFKFGDKRVWNTANLMLCKHTQIITYCIRNNLFQNCVHDTTAKLNIWSVAKIHEIVTKQT